MNNRKFILSLAFIVAGISCFGATYATKWDNKWGQGSIRIKGEPRFNLSRMHTIHLGQAVTLAESATGGRAQGIHLRNMHGYLVFMAEIIMPDSEITNVIVDAGDGRILFSEKHKERQGHDNLDGTAGCEPISVGHGPVQGGNDR